MSGVDHWEKIAGWLMGGKYLGRSDWQTELLRDHLGYGNRIGVQFESDRKMPLLVCHARTLAIGASLHKRQFSHRPMFARKFHALCRNSAGELRLELAEQRF